MVQMTIQLREEASPGISKAAPTERWSGAVAPTPVAFPSFGGHLRHHSLASVQEAPCSGSEARARNGRRYVMPLNINNVHPIACA